jgi:GTP-binding protein of the ras superfamily involved in termination of M-phase
MTDANKNTRQAKRFAKAMKASLIFSSTSHSINVQKVYITPFLFSSAPIALLTHTLQIFKIVLSKAFDLRCTIQEIEHVGEPLLLYKDEK